MKKDHNAFENQIFDAYRKKEKKIKKAVKLLKKEGYIVLVKKEI